MPARSGPTCAALSVALLALPGCSENGPPALRVFAAASLTAPFGALVDAFQQQHPELQVELHCAGTPQLVLQLREGAPADVFASADDVQMGRVVESGRGGAGPSPWTAARGAQLGRGECRFTRVKVRPVMSPQPDRAQSRRAREPELSEGAGA